jgi:pimeloyl-ACP methyl ester carboxylesterase
VQDLASLLQALSPQPVVLVGHSYGADLALRLALAHPELIRGLILDEAPATPLIADWPDYVMIGPSRTAAINGMRAALASRDSVEAMRLLIDWTNAAPGTYVSLTEAQREEALANSAPLAAMLDAPPPPAVSCRDLGTIRVPVLLIEGGRTNPYYHLSTDAVSRCLSTSTHTLLPQAAHDASWQDSHGFDDALISFVDGLHPAD